MNETLNKNLALIQEVANKALELHKNSTKRFGGINYADLRVADVYVRYGIHDEDVSYGVLIEECSQTSYELHEYMLEYLKENLPDYLRDYVYVETGW